MYLPSIVVWGHRRDGGLEVFVHAMKQSNRLNGLSFEWGGLGTLLGHRSDEGLEVVVHAMRQSKIVN